MCKRFLLTFLFLTTSHLLAWQPTGWVYKMGDYMYSSESEAWHWKMADWNLWSRPLSVQTWGASSADGWSYYTWPFFWSHSLKEWCFTASDYGDAFVVNLGSGEWTIFGKTDQGVPSEEETEVVEETTTEEATSEETTNADTTTEETEETEGFARDSFAPGTIIRAYDTIDNEFSLTFVSKEMAFFEDASNEWNSRNEETPVVSVSKDKAYFGYAEDLSWADVGNYTYEKTDDNTAKVSVTYFDLGYSYDAELENNIKYDFVFSSKSNFTSIEYDEEEIIEDPCFILEPQDVAPSSFDNLSVKATTLGGTSTVSFISDSTGSIEGNGTIVNFDYNYKKTGLREGIMTMSFTFEGKPYTAKYICHFRSDSDGFFGGILKDGDTIEEYSFGKFSIE